MPARHAMSFPRPRRCVVAGTAASRGALRAAFRGRSVRCLLPVVFVLAWCWGCQPVLQQDPAASVQQLRSGRGDNGELYLGMDLLVTDETGSAVPCGVGELDLNVSVSFDGPDGEFVPVPADAVSPACVGPGYGDFALVVDNSGSEDGFMDDLKSAAHEMVDRIVPMGGRASVVRVSTHAKVVQELTDSQTELHDAVDGLFVKNGWTALYDGIRMGNETLGKASIEDDRSDRYATREQFCSAGRTRGVVVFTDGQDNNSSLQKLDNPKMKDDGIATTLEDLYKLRVNGTTTPIYTVGLGRGVNASMLQELAEHTGGRFAHIDEPSKLADVFGVIGEYAESTHQVCVDLPAQECGSVHVKIDYSWEHDGQVLAGTKEQVITVDCQPVPQGRSATVLLTLSDPGIPPDTAATLAQQTVAWVSQATNSRVLIVRDGNHHEEDKDDPIYVQALLAEAGMAVDFMEEPALGLSGDDLAGYDAVWFSNPGYSMDDQASLQALEAFSATGGGVVLQGDDMSWSFGMAFDMSGFTHLDFIDNGTRACGERTDDGKGGQYVVQVSDTSHPVTAGLEGASFTYGDDLDESVARHEGEEILVRATAVVDQEGDQVCNMLRPAVVVYQP